MRTLLPILQLWCEEQRGQRRCGFRPEERPGRSGMANMCVCQVTKVYQEKRGTWPVTSDQEVWYILTRCRSSATWRRCWTSGATPRRRSPTWSTSPSTWTPKRWVLCFLEVHLNSRGSRLSGGSLVKCHQFLYFSVKEPYSVEGTDIQVSSALWVM